MKRLLLLFFFLSFGLLGEAVQAAGEPILSSSNNGAKLYTYTSSCKSAALQTTQAFIIPDSISEVTDLYLYFHGTGSPSASSFCGGSGSLCGSATTLASKGKKAAIIVNLGHKGGSEAEDKVMSKEETTCFMNEARQKIASVVTLNSSSLTVAGHSMGSNSILHFLQDGFSANRTIILDGCFRDRCKKIAALNNSGPIAMYATPYLDSLSQASAALKMYPTKINLLEMPGGKDDFSSHNVVATACFLDHILNNQCNGKAKAVKPLSNIPTKDTSETAVQTTELPLFLTPEKIKETVSAPQNKIKIPGLTFSNIDSVEAQKIDSDGTFYLNIPFIGEYISAVYRYLVIIGGIVSVGLIVVAGFEYALPDPSGESKSSAKKRMVGAVTGLIITVSSYTILYTINPELVRFDNLKIIYVRGENLPMPSEETIADTDPSTGQAQTNFSESTTITEKIPNIGDVKAEMFMSTQINTVNVDGFAIWQALTTEQKTEVLPHLFKQIATCPNENTFVTIKDIPNWKGKKIHPNAVEPLRKAVALGESLGFKIFPGGTLRTSDSLVKLWNTGVVARYQTKTKGWQSNQGKISSPSCNSPHATGGAVDANMKDIKNGKVLLAEDSFKITKENYSEHFLNDPYKIILEYIFNQAGWVRLCTEHWHFEYGVTERYQKWDKKSRCWAYGDSYDQPIPDDIKAKVNTLTSKPIL